ncbi:putative Mitochondrial ATP synthase subunit [Trypanosoma cruzi]|uniref:Uncharacterized protein n=1 Tax=Trypanosoma cruzi (strain CL Brener) TaxID=353153 RepID=Q4DL45_TRYCC|nr:hypothetical protein, conserved [Trypanosoma cruzi]EAN93234.1 hypothetical protein, conserved [Trypanosoma cruzi]KAF8298838.1 putative Mitochondrial ATP synthase subunit [Trypanosoma cruzi]RNC50517.1 hypothetical protein TcCL_ESM12431 [Trypanosoma cruzi]|eukprot:XP_815085.1 hypothetical protein [Trypanosoma cruzi strain CL Brener]
MTKYELKLQYFDEWMMRWRKFQTDSDWTIEKNRQWWRQCNMALSAVLFGSLVVYTSGTATLKRQYGLPHFFDVGIDGQIKQTVLQTLTSRWRYTPQGYGRVLLTGIPTYTLFVLLEHYQERRRMHLYVAQNTVFGEQMRRFLNTGKIEEYLAVNIKGSLPPSQRSIYTY